MFSLFKKWFIDSSDTVSSTSTHSSLSSEPSVNPATGLPMLPGGAIDVQGNPFGVDNSDHGHSITDSSDGFWSGSSTSSSDDSWSSSSSSSSWSSDDSWSSSSSSSSFD